MTFQTMPKRGGATRQRGLTLIELLVSLAIGLVIMIAIVSAYIGAAGSSRVAESSSRMNEDAQAALAILTQHIKMTGNNPKQPNYSAASPRNPAFNTGSYAIRGCDQPFSDVTTATGIAALTCPAGTGQDSLAVVYEADRYNTVADASGNPTDCLGAALATTTNGTVSLWSTTASAVVSVSPAFYLAENRFYVGTSTAITTPSLFCKGNGASSTAQPLVENVEDMQLTYGVAPSSATTTFTVAGYVTASGMATTADAAFNALSDADKWARVVTVRVCLIVRSENPVAPDTDSARYYDCTGTLITSPPDLRLRRAYSTTIVLRNRTGT